MSSGCTPADDQITTLLQSLSRLQQENSSDRVFIARVKELLLFIQVTDDATTRMLNDLVQYVKNREENNEE